MVTREGIEGIADETDLIRDGGGMGVRRGGGRRCRGSGHPGPPVLGALRQTMGLRVLVYSFHVVLAIWRYLRWSDCGISCLRAALQAAHGFTRTVLKPCALCWRDSSATGGLAACGEAHGMGLAAAGSARARCRVGSMLARMASSLSVAPRKAASCGRISSGWCTRV